MIHQQVFVQEIQFRDHSIELALRLFNFHRNVVRFWRLPSYLLSFFSKISIDFVYEPFPDFLKFIDYFDIYLCTLVLILERVFKAHDGVDFFFSFKFLDSLIELRWCLFDAGFNWLDLIITIKSTGWFAWVFECLSTH